MTVVFARNKDNRICHFGSSQTNASAEMATTAAMPALDGSGGGPEQLYPLVLELSVPEQRESALLELSKKREEFPELAPILWHSFGTVAALLQEIVSIYPLLSPPQLTAHASNRVCNALALLQCVASHAETRTHFLNGASCACIVYTGEPY